MSYIKKPITVYVCIPHVISKDFISHNNTISFDGASKVVFGSLFHMTNIKVTYYVIGFVFKFKLAEELVMAGADKSVTEGVVGVVEGNLGAVFEGDLFMAANFKVD